MSNPSDGGNSRQTSIQARSAELHNFADHSMSREQAAEAVLIDQDTFTTLKGRERSTAAGTMGRIAESQRSYGEALAEADPRVSGQALATAERQREDIVRAQTEYRQTPEGMAAAPQADILREAVRLAEVEHDGRRAGRSYADLGPVAADRVTAADAQAFKGIEYRQREPGRDQGDGRSSRRTWLGDREPQTLTRVCSAGLDRCQRAGAQGCGPHTDSGRQGSGHPGTSAP